MSCFFVMQQPSKNQVIHILNRFENLLSCVTFAQMQPTLLSSNSYAVEAQCFQDSEVFTMSLSVGTGVSCWTSWCVGAEGGTGTQFHGAWAAPQSLTAHLTVDSNKYEFSPEVLKSVPFYYSQMDV